MPTVVDDRGVTVHLAHPPRRIVSLVPSTTQTLCALGCADAVVGVTRFCVHPADVVAGLPKVGGTKDVDRQRVVDLAPDLIVGNCEENTRAIFDDLDDVAPLYAAFPRDVEDALADLLRLGHLLGRDEAAASWHARITAARSALHAAARPQRVAYLIWRDPWMTVGRDTFVHHVLAEAGLHNVFADATDRFPTITADQLADARPDRVLLSSEPFPFRVRHADELAAATGLPREAFVFVDGESCTWHGTGMAQGFDTLARAVTTGFHGVPS